MLDARIALHFGARPKTVISELFVPGSGRMVASADCDRQRDLPDPGGAIRIAAVRIPEG